MIKQRKIVISGPSTISVGDAGLAALGGFVVPLVVDRALNSMDWTLDHAWMRDYSPQLGAAMGVLVALPLGYWRGMGVGVLTAVIGLTYGLSLLVDRWIGEMGTTAPVPQLPATTPTAGLGLLRQVPAAPRRLAPRANQAIAARDMAAAFGGVPY